MFGDQRHIETLQMLRFPIDEMKGEDLPRLHPEIAGLAINLAKLGCPISLAGERRVKAALRDGLRLALGLRVERPHPEAGWFQHELRESAKRWGMLYGLVDEFCSPHVALELLLRGRFAGQDTFSLTFGSDAFPYVLADTFKELLQTRAEDVPPSWPAWCGESEVKDFRSKLAGVDVVGSLPPIGEGGEFEQRTIQDLGTGVILGCYGIRLRVTRKTMINDDLKAFSRPGELYGPAAPATEDDAAYGLLTANPNAVDGVALFHASRSNTLTTASPTVANMDAARVKLRAMRLADGVRALGLRPKHVLVPSALASQAAESIGKINQAESEGARLELTVDARLDETSETAWYLAADKLQRPAIVVAFLTGRRQPEVTQKTDFDTDDFVTKISHTCGAAIVAPTSIIRIGS